MPRSMLSAAASAFTALMAHTQRAQAVAGCPALLTELARAVAQLQVQGGLLQPPAGWPADLPAPLAHLQHSKRWSVGLLLRTGQEHCQTAVVLTRGRLSCASALSQAVKLREQAADRRVTTTCA